MATESFTCLRRNGPKTVIAVKHGLRDRGMFTAKRPRRKLPSYSSLNSEEMPLSFKHIFALIPYTMPLFGGASVYTWHCPNIHVSESYV